MKGGGGLCGCVGEQRKSRSFGFVGCWVTLGMLGLRLRCRAWDEVPIRQYPTKTQGSPSQSVFPNLPRLYHSPAFHESRMLYLCKLHNYLHLTWQETLLIVSKQTESLAWCESGERGRESQAVALHVAFSL